MMSTVETEGVERRITPRARDLTPTMEAAE
jgi:hypothetical protein